MKYTNILTSRAVGVPQDCQSEDRTDLIKRVAEHAFARRLVGSEEG